MRNNVDPLWQRYATVKTPSIKNDLMVKYLGLVHYVVNSLFRNIPKSIERDDLVNIGVIGLGEALERYNPYLGIKFETYSIPRIRGAIIDELRKLDWVPRSLRAKSNLIKNAIGRLEQEKADDFTDSDIANELGITMDEFHNWQADLNKINMLSLDKEAPKIAEQNLYDVIPNEESINPLEEIENEELKKLLVKALKTLPEKSRLAVTLYYFEKLTFKEIGHILKVSESRVSQIHSESMNRLKKVLKKEVAA
ncbi:MAG: FliA/WhiG family RNA polymerase sigma factor [Calditrichia bacterium]|nr:FliA/WhiG family RNA polymerase sigma factor [Calditrichia bacterium]